MLIVTPVTNSTPESTRHRRYHSDTMREIELKFFFSNNAENPVTVPTRSTDSDNSDDSVAGDLSDGEESDSSMNSRANASGAESIERERADRTPYVDEGPDEQMSRTSSGGDLDTTHADSSGDESGESSASDHESARSFLEELLNEDDVPLYDGADITVRESVTAIFLHSNRHILSGEATDSTLKLIELHCPQPNRFITTLYKYRKFFDSQRTPIKRQFYCAQCMNPFKIGTQECSKCLDPVDKDSSFIHMSIIEQLKEMFAREDFREKLRLFRNRQEKTSCKFGRSL
ncbi:hypothetical protein QAD02_003420 [Eretmocerus hayati]|uniref:Uncharacterized protein n=1 Tax=Eretmocerus hayati TaxID=131215 RepID=A0ACC2NNH0_9HYME|nr:hypothetical protein QAD02_003420 [Eretmocerus hayati]